MAHEIETEKGAPPHNPPVGGRVLPAHAPDQPFSGCARRPRIAEWPRVPTDCHRGNGLNAASRAAPPRTDPPARMIGRTLGSASHRRSRGKEVSIEPEAGRPRSKGPICWGPRDLHDARRTRIAFHREVTNVEVPTKDPYQLFEEELPDLAERFDAIVQAQIARPGLDPKTKQLLNIAIQTANRNPRGVMWHAAMARKQGVTRDDVVGAVALNLHLTGLAAVLDALPAALQGYEMKIGRASCRERV